MENSQYPNRFPIQFPHIKQILNDLHWRFFSQLKNYKILLYGKIFFFAYWKLLSRSCRVLRLKWGIKNVWKEDLNKVIVDEGPTDWNFE